MRADSLRHEFVEFIPAVLEEGVLCISIRFSTASHLCACGCGRKVVTPIKPTRWILIFDGDAVSLWPSIGRWQLPCRSHYWIEKDKIRWAAGWTDEKIAAGIARDALDVRRYYENRTAVPDRQPVADAPTKRPGLLGRALYKLRHHRTVDKGAGPGR